MKFKKIAGVLLSLSLCFGLVACGGDDQSKQDAPPTVTESQESTEINFEEDPYTIHVCYATMGEAQPDLPMIQEKLNEITLKEINVNVELEAISISNLANSYALKASGQEKMDLMVLFPAFNYLTTYVNSNMLMPLEELVEQWGPDIKNLVGNMFPAGEYNGHLYAIPQNRGVRTNAYGFNLSRALCEKYSIDTSAIKTLEDLEKVFQLIKEKEPDITVVMPDTLGSNVAGSLSSYMDTLGIGGGVLSVEADGSLKVVNSLEESQAMENYKIVRDWYEKGYISKDVLTIQDDGVSSLKAGKCFATATASIDPGMGNEDYQSVIINPEKPLVGTSADQMIMWGISNTCERPDKAVQFLNLCDSSAEVTNLMQYGVEDVHYTFLQDGVVDSSMNQNWVNFWPQFGDNTQAYVTGGSLESMGANTLDEYREKLGVWDVEMSPAYGFNFDPTNVRTEIAACDAVNAEYATVLGDGTVDPEEELPKYIEKLYDAGLQKVMDEKQTQLDKWLESKTE